MGSIHDVLYLNSQYRKKEHEVLVKEYETRTSCTFYPQLVSKQSSKPRSLEDILKSKQQYEENMTEYKRALEQQMNNTLFHPETGRPNKDRQTNASTIYDHLIKHGNTMNEKHEKERTVEFSKFRDNAPNVDTRSVKMLQEKKEKILNDIFDQLDGKQQGQIDMDNLNVDNFSAHLLTFFEPIFEEI